MANYVAVSGMGMSGTKRVLKLLDLSPVTHCRCEPTGRIGSPFKDLPTHETYRASDEPAIEAGWDAAVEWAGRRIGCRDRFSAYKHHYHAWGRRLQLYRLIKHQRLRRAVSVVIPALRGEEWLMPKWLGSEQALRNAVLVMKTGPIPNWLIWVLRHRPEARVVDVVRHPGGFLNSFIGRWLSTYRESEIVSLSRRRLHNIRTADSRWDGIFGDIESMGVKELELWYWRYVNELMTSAGQASKSYLLIRDEEVAEDPIAAARRIYHHAGVPWCDAATEFLERMAPSWRQKRSMWRDLLSKEDVKLVERVLEGSSMASWWDDNQVVSLFDYVAY